MLSSRQFIRLFLKRPVFFLLGMALAGCAGAPSVLAPASENAGRIANLTSTIFIIAAVVFVVVEGLLIYAAIRYRQRVKEGLPPQIEGNQRLEIAWTLAPAVVLLIVFIVSLPTLAAVGYLPGAAPSQTIHVRAIGHQWWWEFDYPDLKIKTANEMHIPVGYKVEVELESTDVIHSFWVPQLGGKTDVIPGQTNHMWFDAKTSGKYLGQCAEFCGVQHANMRMYVIAESQEDFQAWVAGQQAPMATLTGDAQQGEQVFMKGACVGCHTINGTDAKGVVGPNLTHLSSRTVIAGGTLPNTVDNMTAWLKDPQQVKPGNQMPNLHLTPDQIKLLIIFLGQLK